MDEQENAIMNEAGHNNEDELQKDEDYLKDDDDDDFARKLGGIFSWLVTCIRRSVESCL